MNKDGEEVTAATHWILPVVDFSGLWENLFYEAGVKENVCIKTILSSQNLLVIHATT